MGPSVHLTTAPARAPRAPGIPKPVVPLTGSALDKWHYATAALLASPHEIERIAKWRGLGEAAVAFAAERGLIGIYQYWGIPREAFLVETPSPDGLLPVSVHVRLAPGSRGNEGQTKASWRYDPPGCGAWPWVVGDLATAKHIFIIEGQWDALALISVMGWHLSFPPTTAVAGLRGATSVAKLLLHPINPDAYIFAIADADGAGAKWFDENGLLAALTERINHPDRLHAFWPATPGADLNDLVKRGELTRPHLLDIILPLLPPRRTLRLPTFVEWCRRHAQDEDPIGASVRHVLSDPVRSRWPRRPLRAWLAHWQRTEVPAPLLQNLEAAWKNYHADPIA